MLARAEAQRPVVSDTGALESERPVSRRGAALPPADGEETDAAGPTSLAPRESFRAAMELTTRRAGAAIAAPDPSRPAAVSERPPAGRFGERGASSVCVAPITAGRDWRAAARRVPRGFRPLDL